MEKKPNKKDPVKKKKKEKEFSKKKKEPVKKKKEKKEPVKNNKKIIIEKDFNPDVDEIDENKYSEKLKKLLTSIKNRSHTDSEVKIRFGWKY